MNGNGLLYYRLSAALEVKTSVTQNLKKCLMTQSWHQKQDWRRQPSFFILRLSGCRRRSCWKQLTTDDEEPPPYPSPVKGEGIKEIYKLMEHDTKYKRLKDLSREEYILPGTTMCGGGGGLEALRLVFMDFCR